MTDDDFKFLLVKMELMFKTGKAATNNYERFNVYELARELIASIERSNGVKPQFKPRVIKDDQ